MLRGNLAEEDDRPRAWRGCRIDPAPIGIPFGYNAPIMQENDLAAAAARLRTALDLFDTGVEIKRRGLMRLFPDADTATIERKIVEWLRTRPGAEHGDAVGRPGRWPRDGS